jgi:hypothetical protein
MKRTYNKELVPARPSSSSSISEKANRIILKFSKFGVLTAMFLKLQVLWNVILWR